TETRYGGFNLCQNHSMVEISIASKILNELNSSSLSGIELRKFAMEQLDQLQDYNWSGIYRLEGETLVLDAYVGAATDHTHIPVGRGVCGTAVAEDKNQVITDVRELTNYLACSTQTRSEIVVLIRKGDTILGQIDIDGHRVAAFDSSDEQLLEDIAAILADRWE
ncbi:MAG: GAF domain-containing protein, partial [Fimbriimonadaceae bacterium]|nr:GAF domain-containing protein [Fimbriimonadaceae bacterium]